MKYLLDTDHISFLLLNNAPERGRIEGNIHRVGQHGVGLSIVSFHEQMMGCHNKLIRATGPDELVQWYLLMGDIFDLYAKSNLVLFDSAAALEFNGLRRIRKLRIKPMDLRIASIALSRNMTVVTRNLADFGRVPNLPIENWTL